MKKDTKIFKDNLKNGQKVVNLHNVLPQFNTNNTNDTKHTLKL